MSWFYLSQRQNGSTLLWVVILTFTVSVTALQLARFEFTQHQLVSFYDIGNQSDRDFRRSDMAIKAYIAEVFEAGESPVCFNETDKYRQCAMDDLTHWQVEARRLTEQELTESLVNRFTNIDQGTVVYDVWLSLKYTPSLDHLFGARDVIYRVLKLENSQIRVTRYLVWLR
jgi:hypothetical protein